MIRVNLSHFQKKIDTFPTPENYEILENERILETRVPIHLEGDLDKVKGSPFGISVENELKEFYSKEYRSGPFFHYQLENMLLLKNRIYFSDYEYRLIPSEKPVRVYNSKYVDSYENAAFTSMRITTAFFGHWLHEELILIDYLQGNNNIISTSPLTQQKLEISSFFNLNFHTASFAKIKTVDMYEGYQHSNIYNKILKKYKEKISSLPVKEKGSRKRIVYLRRGNSGENRILENEENMLESLSKDFDLITLIAENISIQELYALIYSADIILGIEGSQMAHGIIAGKVGSNLVCIQPPKRFYNPFKNYCMDVGVIYAVVVAEQGQHDKSFVVDLNRLKILFDKLY